MEGEGTLLVSLGHWLGVVLETSSVILRMVLFKI